jgi:hypothetical protein
MALLDGDEGVAESVGKWVVYWSVVKGRTGLLFGQVGEVVS